MIKILLLTGIAAAVVAVLAFSCFVTRKRNPNVIRLDRHARRRKRMGAGTGGKVTGKEQKCSYCKKKSTAITFYAANDGSVVGVCKDCSAIAKRQELLPL